MKQNEKNEKEREKKKVQSQINGTKPHSVLTTTPVSIVKDQLSQIDPKNDFLLSLQKDVKKQKSKKKKLRGTALLQAVVTFLTLSYPLFFSAQEICTEFSVKRNTISAHLNRLHKDGKVEKIKVSDLKKGRPIVKYKIMTPSSNKGPPTK